MNPLLKAAKEFRRLAGTEIKVVENGNEILSELSAAKNFDDRVELAEEEKDWKKLGEGSSRVIFQMSDSLIIKIAFNDAGLEQNKSEMSMRADCLNNVLVADTEGKWLVMRFTDSMTEDDFKNYTGFGFKTFMSGLFYQWNNEYHDGKPKEFGEIKEHPLFIELSKLVEKKGLQIGDISKTSSWGMLDGKPLLRDFGLTKDVFSEHYDGVTGNVTSTPTP